MSYEAREAAYRKFIKANELGSVYRWQFDAGYDAAVASLAPVIEAAKAVAQDVEKRDGYGRDRYVDNVLISALVAALRDAGYLEEGLTERESEKFNPDRTTAGPFLSMAEASMVAEDIVGARICNIVFSCHGDGTVSLEIDGKDVAR